MTCQVADRLDVRTATAVVGYWAEPVTKLRMHRLRARPNSEIYSYRAVQPSSCAAGAPSRPDD
eukprot:scaffold103895_cov29-Tisochrysis_lutea.AAC.1